MRRLGLRARLMLFYGLMALAPILLAGYLLYAYLGAQTTQSLAHLQTQAEHQLRRYHRTTTQAAEQAFEESLRATQPALEHQLHEFRQTAQTQQSQALKQSLAQISAQLQQDLQQVQTETERNTQRTFAQASQRIEAVQRQALATLLAESSQATQSALSELIKAQLNLLAESLSRQVEAIARDYITQLTLIAQQPAIQSARETESRWILQSLQNREPAYQLLAVLNAQGKPQLILSDEEIPETVLTPLIQPLWDALQRTDDPMVGAPVVVTIGLRPTPCVPLMAPIRQRGTELVGAVFAIASLDEMRQLLQTFRIGKRGVASLVAADGTLLAHPDSRQVGSRFALALPEQGTVQEMETPDGRTLVTTARIAQLNAYLVITQPTEEAFQLVQALQERLQHSYQVQSGEIQRALQQIRGELQGQLASQQQRSRTQIRASLKQVQTHTQQQLTDTLNALSQHQRTGWLALLQNSFRLLQENLYKQIATVQSQMFEQTRQQFGIIRQQIVENITQQMQNAFLIALFTVAVFILLGGLYLHRTLVRPLRAIVNASHAIAQGNLAQRVQLPYRGCPDLNHLAESLNFMIDSLRQAEAQLIQSSKLASLGTLASGVAHELNQPLAIIRAIAQQNLELLRKGELTPQQRALLEEDLQIVERQTARMSQIILHLRTFARKPSEAMEPVNLNEVARNALILLREQLRQREITLIEEYDETLPTVMGEANALEQIVINLLTNARDALEATPNAQIRIATRKVERDGALWVELCVADNGPGVPEAIRSQIFDPFFTTKDPNKGTGLGLAISLEIAQKHKGTLRLEPTERGACFVLQLPAAQTEREAA